MLMSILPKESELQPESIHEKQVLQHELAEDAAEDLFTRLKLLQRHLEFRESSFVRLRSLHIYLLPALYLRATGHFSIFPLNLDAYSLSCIQQWIFRQTTSKTNSAI